MPCDCCNEKKWMFEDLRPRRDRLAKGVVFDYRTPIENYKEYLVCNDCFHSDDKKFFKVLEQTEKLEQAKVA
jgi:hypothetical protein